MRPNMLQGFLERRFHLLGGRLRGNLRSHVVQVFAKALGFLAVLTLQSAIDDMRQIALGRHAGCARLGFKRGGILLRQVNRQVRRLSF